MGKTKDCFLGEIVTDINNEWHAQDQAKPPIASKYNDKTPYLLFVPGTSTAITYNVESVEKKTEEHPLIETKSNQQMEIEMTNDLKNERSLRNDMHSNAKDLDGIKNSNVEIDTYNPKDTKIATKMKTTEESEQHNI
eukprot:445499_1